MSYYILPKNNNKIISDPTSDQHNECLPIISFSIDNYYKKMYDQINLMCCQSDDFSLNSFFELIKIINPYEFIFSKVPGSKYSVSKLRPNSNIFYDFLEILITFNIFDLYKSQNINLLCISSNYNDINECSEMLRENFNDTIFSFENFNGEIFNSLKERKMNFLFMDTFDSNLNNYLINFIQSVMIILKCSTHNSSSIIKIHHTIYKPVLDLIYLLCSLFDKVYIMKPNSNNITSFEKYLVCKGFNYDESKNENYKINYYKLLVFLKKLNNKNIVSIINKDLPYYFLNKIDDMNIIIGQQQLESLDHIINIIKNKNKEDKIETIKKLNIQKSVIWCEKYKIPCNKFTDKTNIFLPITTKEEKIQEA